MQPINVLIKPVSGMCNMNCDYCFYRDEAQKRTTESYGVMSQETLKNVIRKTMLNAQGYASYLYQGGEPTLCGLSFFRNAVEYQKKYNRNGIRIYNALQTNGYCIDEEWCRFFRQENFLVGLSVDGTETLHNKYRHDKQGGGTYERVLRSAKLFDRYGVEYNILTVVTRELAEHISEVYREYQKRNWRYQQYIVCLEPLEEEPGNCQYSLTPEDYGRFLIRLFDLWYEDYERGREPYIREFSNYIRILQGYLPENCAMRGKCTLQNVVEADGSVYPCDFYALDEFCLGNFNQNKFSELQENASGKRFMERSEKLISDCGKCEFFRLCRGGCQRNRLLQPETGQYRNYFCESYRSFFEECHKKLLKIAEKGKMPL